MVLEHKDGKFMVSVYEDYQSTYDILLKKGNHEMLYIGYLRNMATEIFKALHGSTPIYIRGLFEEKDKIYNLHSTVSLNQPKCNTVTYGLNSFRYKVQRYRMIFQVK